MSQKNGDISHDLIEFEWWPGPKQETWLEYLVISSVTTNHKNMLLLLLMLKMTLWWQWYLQSVIEIVAVFFETPFRREFKFIFFSLRRGDDWRVIKKSYTFWDYICNFFVRAINHNFSSLTELVWLTDRQS